MTAVLPPVGILATLALVSFVACNERFEFDVPPGDSTGSTSTASDAEVAIDSATDAPTMTSTGTTGAGPGAVCSIDADCRLAALHCHPTLGQCSECFEDQHCSNVDSAYCDLELFRCVTCTQDAHCATGFRCDAVERRCAPICANAQDCVDAHACNNGLCVACDRDVECRTGDPARPVCSASGLGCVTCREDTQCPPQELCDVLSGLCVSCLNSAHCDHQSVCDPVLLECVTG